MACLLIVFISLTMTQCLVTHCGVLSEAEKICWSLEAAQIENRSYLDGNWFLISRSHFSHESNQSECLVFHFNTVAQNDWYLEKNVSDNKGVQLQSQRGRQVAALSNTNKAVFVMRSVGHIGASSQMSIVHVDPEFAVVVECSTRIEGSVNKVHSNMVSVLSRSSDPDEAKLDHLEANLIGAGILRQPEHRNDWVECFGEGAVVNKMRKGIQLMKNMEGEDERWLLAEYQLCLARATTMVMMDECWMKYHQSLRIRTHSRK